MTADFEAIIGDLRSPDAFPHPPNGDVHVIQTHISCVFIAGEFAYKIKKPVKLAFLDFSTLEKRKHYCEEELRLNGALCPALYIEVVPLYRVDGRYTFVQQQNATPVDYAVKMKAFREDDVLDSAFDQGRIDTDHIRQLAHQIAEFHRNAPTDERIARYGAIEKIRETAEGNYKAIDNYLQSPPSMQSIREYTANFMKQHAALFERRVEEGAIRECHGDLHLGNICFFQGNIELFDRIEYNEPFKNIDVVYDLAFLFMDLRFRGRADWAYLLVNTYVDQTGDYEGLLLLPFYANIRAMVRAKVYAILSSEEEAGESRRKKARQTANDYIEHAARYTKSGDGRITLMCGLSGSGKSTIARQLAVKLPAYHLRSDVLRKHLAGLEPGQSAAALYTEAWSNTTYRELQRIGIALAQEGHHVILDATFSQRNGRNAFRAAAQKAGIPVTILYCHAPETELRQRLNTRQSDASDADIAVLEKQLQQFDTPAEDEATVNLDTTQPLNLDTLTQTLKQPAST